MAPRFVLGRPAMLNVLEAYASVAGLPAALRETILSIRFVFMQHMYT